ncbi:MAG: hypothetical protein ABEJ82_07970 [Haloplanus sp.]
MDVELVPALLEVVAFAVGTAGLASLGAYTERFALVTVQSGEPKLGAWVALMGAMAFYFAYLMATDKLRPGVASLRDNLYERNSARRAD